MRFLFPSQSKKSYEQRCKEADEAEQTAEKMSNATTATPKQIEKVNLKSFKAKCKDFKSGQNLYMSGSAVFQSVHVTAKI